MAPVDLDQPVRQRHLQVGPVVALSSLENEPLAQRSCLRRIPSGWASQAGRSRLRGPCAAPTNIGFHSSNSPVFGSDFSTAVARRSKTASRGIAPICSKCSAIDCTKVSVRWYSYQVSGIVAPPRSWSRPTPCARSTARRPREP